MIIRVFPACGLPFVPCSIIYGDLVTKWEVLKHPKSSTALATIAVKHYLCALQSFLGQRRLDRELGA